MVLSGRRLTKDVLNVAAKHKFQSITSLELSKFYTLKVTTESIINLVSSLPNLKTFKTDLHCCNFDSLQWLEEACQKSTITDLHLLSVTPGTTCCMLRYFGAAFPNLQSLTINRLILREESSSHSLIQDPQPFVPLPNLQNLKIISVQCSLSYTHYDPNTNLLQELIIRLAGATPNLESLVLLHQNVYGSKPNAYRPLNNALEGTQWPKLKRLELHGMQVTVPNDFTDLFAPCLESIGVGSVKYPLSKEPVFFSGNDEMAVVTLKHIFPKLSSFTSNPSVPIDKVKEKADQEDSSDVSD
ncbi:hypothetical protein BKA69DRAFT_465870 [Paraphysoderma sedebokerense]|nr:hypothetical protein BKA69DRAFT_465870 [Paraphysoderma sedebokerense]